MKTGGFTLIELMVVLAILGVVAAVTVPALASLVAPREPLEQTASELAFLLRGARRLAIERGRGVIVVLDPSRNRYRMELEDARAEETIDTDSSVSEGALHIPSGVRFLGPSTPLRFRFDRLGSAHGPVIRIQDEATLQVRISISPWTGELRVERDR